MVAGGTHHALVCPPLIVQPNHAGGDTCRVRAVDQPLPTCTAERAAAVLQPPGTLYVKNYTARNQKVNGGMVHPVSDPLGWVTATDHRALLVPYYRTGVARPVTEPMGTVETRDRNALVEVEVDLDDCTFRMLEPHEVGAAMAFPGSYRVEGTKNAFEPSPVAAFAGDDALLEDTSTPHPAIPTPASVSTKAQRLTRRDLMTASSAQPDGPES